MAKRKAVKRSKAKAKPGVVALAERIGSFLGRVRKKADSLLPGPPRKPGKAKKALAPPKRASAKAGKKAKR